MPIQTQIRFKDFGKALKKIAEVKDFYIYESNKRGSGRRYEFVKSDKITLMSFVVVHEADRLYSDDYKKVLAALNMSKEEFESFL